MNIPQFINRPNFPGIPQSNLNPFPTNAFIHQPKPALNIQFQVPTPLNIQMPNFPTNSLVQPQHHFTCISSQPTIPFILPSSLFQVQKNLFFFETIQSKLLPDQELLFRSYGYLLQRNFDGALKTVNQAEFTPSINYHASTIKALSYYYLGDFINSTSTIQAIQPQPANITPFKANLLKDLFSVSFIATMEKNPKKKPSPLDLLGLYSSEYYMKSPDMDNSSLINYFNEIPGSTNLSSALSAFEENFNFALKYGKLNALLSQIDLSDQYVDLSSPFSIQKIAGDKVYPWKPRRGLRLIERLFDAMSLPGDLFDDSEVQLQFTENAILIRNGLSLFLAQNHIQIASQAYPYDQVAKDLRSELGILGAGNPSEPSTMFDLEKEEPEGFHIILINGACNNSSDAKSNAMVISEMCGGKNVHVVYNGSQGLVLDGNELFLNKVGVRTNPNEYISNTINKLAENYPKDKIMLIAHSQGAPISGLELRNLDPTIRDKMNVVTLGGAGWINKNQARRVRNYVNENDYPSLACNILKLFRKGDYNLVYLPKKGGGHAYMSENYQEAINAEIKYINGGGI